MTIQKAVTTILAGHIVEFSYHDAAYLIQAENNKGYNYLSIWRTAPDYVCLDRVFFDIDDGIDEETAWELLSRRCIEGNSVEDIIGDCLTIYTGQIMNRAETSEMFDRETK